MKNYIFGLTVLLITLSCNEKEADNDASSEALEAFSRVDEKAKTAFTYNERKKAYKKSMGISADSKASLENNATYTGYGSAKKPSSKKVAQAESTTAVKKKKRAYYTTSSKKNQQISYSAYDTN